eukprot:Hpha_TRINITY_DN16603_c3_g8::TRINITY_DN16603_c3_g8_i1::g.183069::m.183069
MWPQRVVQGEAPLFSPLWPPADSASRRRHRDPNSGSSTVSHRVAPSPRGALRREKRPGRHDPTRSPGSVSRASHCGFSERASPCRSLASARTPSRPRLPDCVVDEVLTTAPSLCPPPSSTRMLSECTVARVAALRQRLLVGKLHQRSTRVENLHQLRQVAMRSAGRRVERRGLSACLAASAALLRSSGACTAAEVAVVACIPVLLQVERAVISVPRLLQTDGVV